MKRAALMCAVILAIIASPFVRAEGEMLNEAQIASVRSGCADALQTMLHVQRVEAVTRVNRGHEYEGVLRLFAALNSRAALNKLDVAALVTTTSQIQSKFAVFQKHYIEYANRMDEALEINCKRTPVMFYDKLTLVREARSAIAADIKEIDALLDEYEAGVELLKQHVSADKGGE